MWRTFVGQRFFRQRQIGAKQTVTAIPRALATLTEADMCFVEGKLPGRDPALASRDPS